MSGGRSNAGEIIEERTTQEVFEVPAPLPPPPPPAPVPEIVEEHVKTTTIERRDVSPARSYQSHSSHHHHHRHDSAPVIVHAKEVRNESDFIETTRKEKQVEIRSAPTPVGALALIPADRSRDARSISAEIRALEAEKEALKAERRANREIRRAERLRRDGAGGEMVVRREREIVGAPGEVVLYEERVREVEPSGGVRIERDRKGRMAISVPKKYR